MSSELSTRAVKIFEHGEQLIYDGNFYLHLLVQDIIEAFQELANEPSFLDITVSVPNNSYNLGGWGPANQTPARMDHPTEVWPQIYDKYLPCSACTIVETSTSWRIKRILDTWNSATEWPLPKGTTSVQYVVEKFHVASRHFDKQLEVELHFAIADPLIGDDDTPVRLPTAPEQEKADLHKLTIRLVDGSCRGPTHAVTRKSKSILLISDFALEVYGFMDRVHVGASLVANCGLNEQIFKLLHLLPVHHLICKFERVKNEKEMHFGPRKHVPDYYWMILHHFQRDLTYSDVRRFKVSSLAGSTDAKCALIRRYLSNSHVVDFKAAPAEPRFTVEILATLVDCNFSLGRLRMCALDGPMADYRLMDAVFRSGMRLRALNLRIYGDCLHRLIKNSDFLRMRMVQQLKEFKLLLINPELLTRRRLSVLATSAPSAPLLTTGVHLLRNCALYRVDWEAAWPDEWDSFFESAALKLVEICEKFERGEMSGTAENCAFRFPIRVAFPFNDDNKIASAVSVVDSWGSYLWDVYRFRNVTTGEWLTACVGRPSGYAFALNIVKGEAYPDASYYDYPNLM